MEPNFFFLANFAIFFVFSDLHNAVLFKLDGEELVQIFDLEVDPASDVNRFNEVLHTFSAVELPKDAVLVVFHHCFDGRLVLLELLQVGLGVDLRAWVRAKVYDEFLKNSCANDEEAVG